MSTAELTDVLPAVLRDGVADSTTDVLRPLFPLQCVQGRASDTGDDEALTQAAREVIGHAVAALGSGPYGRAASLLFGLTDDSRGQARHVRRDLAADQVGVMGRWFARSYERQILQSVASAIYDLEHPLPASAGTDPSTAVVRAGTPDAADTPTSADTGTAITTAEQDPGDPSAEGDPQGDDGKGEDRRGEDRRAGRSPWRRAFGLVRPPTDDEAVAVVMASPHHALTGGQPRQLLQDLQQIRDQQARKQWILFYVITGLVVLWRYGVDAVPRYILILAILGAVKTVTDMVRAWRVTRSLKLQEQWPRLAILIMTIGVAGSVVATQDDRDIRIDYSALRCEMWGNDCDDDATTTTVEPPSPNYTPTTYATVPEQAAEPECPPADNRERRIRFTDPPPMCIDPRNRYTATVWTNYGFFTVRLNARDAPWTVNNFVFLARWRFYDGVQLQQSPEPVQSYSYLLSLPPVETENGSSTGTDVPGYTLIFDQHEADYPNNQTLYLVMTDTSEPDAFAVVVSPFGHEQVVATQREDPQRSYPLLGQIVDCHEVIATRDTGNDGWQVRPTSEAIVIETITITEEPAGTPATVPRTPIPNTDPCGQFSATGH